jgi:hypothetical protein
MAAEPCYDLILLGFRNDLARARTLEFLRRNGEDVAAGLDGSVAVPVRLYQGLTRDRLASFRAQLEGLGAQVTARATTVAAPVAPVPRSRPQKGMNGLLALLTAGLVAAAYWWRPALPEPRPGPALLPAAANSEESAVEARHSLPFVGIQSAPPSEAHIDDPQAQALNNQAVRLAQAGEFARAVDELEDALRYAPDDPVVLRNLQTVLLNWGIADLIADRLDDAIAHLEEAAQLGERVEVLQALGVAHTRRGNYAAATAALERVLEIVPSDGTALVALAEAYAHLDRRPEALDLLYRAREAGVHGPDLDQRAQLLSREIDAEWDFVHLQDSHFRVSLADDEESDAVEPILDALDDAYHVVGAKFAHYPSSRTPVVLYTQQDFHAITQTPDWAGGAYDGRIKIPVRGLTAGDPQLARVVRHEYAHSVIATVAGPRCPIWLNEGLAVWAEEVTEGERQDWAQERIAGRQLFDLTQLTSSFVSLPADRIDVAYAQSYLAVRLLVDEYGAHRLPDLLAAINRYGNLNDAFIDTYRENFSRFQQRLLARLTG